MAQDVLERNRTTDLGVIRINNNVVTSIAAIAAMEIEGVQRLGCSIGKTLYEIFASRSRPCGVRIKSSGGEIKLSVSIIVDYGVDIARIADRVQENVKRAVEKMTGLVIQEVDVVVEGVAANPRARP